MTTEETAPPEVTQEVVKKDIYNGFPTGDDFLADEDLAVSEAAARIHAVLEKLNEAVMRFSKEGFPVSTIQPFMRRLGQVISELYSAVPNQWAGKVEALVNEHMFPKDSEIAKEIEPDNNKYTGNIIIP